MDIRDYIASGILEEYILGQLSPEQRAEVEAMAAQHPEVRDELRAIEEALAHYGMAWSRPLPEGVRQRILEKTSTPPPATPVAARPANPRRWYFLGMALLAGLLLWTFWRQSRTADELDQLRREQDILAVRCDSVAERNALLERQLQIVLDPDNQMVRMEGTEKSASSLAVVHYNPADSTSYLEVDALPVPTPDKQYQLWAIVEGAPVSMGVFDLPADSAILISVPHVANAQAFAVTLEPAGGVESPTLEEMYVIGTVGG